MSCLREGGLCILEHVSSNHDHGANELDPFGADLCIMPYLIAKWGNGRYAVKELIEAPAKRPNVEAITFIVILKLPAAPLTQT